jgi:hypothetical protein
MADRLLQSYPGATSVMGVWTLGLGLLGDSESAEHKRACKQNRD